MYKTVFFVHEKYDCAYDPKRTQKQAKYMKTNRILCTV